MAYARRSNAYGYKSMHWFNNYMRVALRHTDMIISQVVRY